MRDFLDQSLAFFGLSFVYSSISSLKGSSLLYMVENMLGKSVFSDALKIYTDRFADTNADRFDLWNILESAANETAVLEGYDFTLTDVLESWAVQEGYPVTTVFR